MSPSLTSIVEQVLSHESITHDDITNFRTATYADGLVDDEEASAIFKVNAECKAESTEWKGFFIEVLTDYVVTQQSPEGYVTAEISAWLIDQVSRNGKVANRLELDLLVNILDRSRWSPQSLVTFSLQQVKHAVISASEALREDEAGGENTISDDEVALVRRILYAFGGDGNISITRAEAEVLFEINDAISAHAPNPAWTELFCLALTNVLMAHSGYAVPSRESALSSEAWLDQRSELSLGNIFSEMFSEGLSGTIKAYKEQTSEERALERLELERISIITNEEITEDEVDWLIDRLGRDGKLNPNEEAFVDYLMKESHKVHPKLMAFVEKLSVVA